MGQEASIPSSEAAKTESGQEVHSNGHRNETIPGEMLAREEDIPFEMIDSSSDGEIEWLEPPPKTNLPTMTEKKPIEEDDMICSNSPNCEMEEYIDRNANETDSLKRKWTDLDVFVCEEKKDDVDLSVGGGLPGQETLMALYCHNGDSLALSFAPLVGFSPEVLSAHFSQWGKVQFMNCIGNQYCIYFSTEVERNTALANAFHVICGETVACYRGDLVSTVGAQWPSPIPNGLHMGMITPILSSGNSFPEGFYGTQLFMTDGVEVNPCTVSVGGIISGMNVTPLSDAAALLGGKLIVHARPLNTIDATFVFPSGEKAQTFLLDCHTIMSGLTFAIPGKVFVRLIRCPFRGNEFLYELEKKLNTRIVDYEEYCGVNPSDVYGFIRFQYWDDASRILEMQRVYYESSKGFMVFQSIVQTRPLVKTDWPIRKSRYASVDFLAEKTLSREGTELRQEVEGQKNDTIEHSNTSDSTCAPPINPNILPSSMCYLMINCVPSMIFMKKTWMSELEKFGVEKAQVIGSTLSTAYSHCKLYMQHSKAISLLDQSPISIWGTTVDIDICSQVFLKINGSPSLDDLTVAITESFGPISNLVDPAQSYKFIVFHRIQDARAIISAGGVMVNGLWQSARPSVTNNAFLPFEQWAYINRAKMNTKTSIELMRTRNVEEEKKKKKEVMGIEGMKQLENTKTQREEKTGEEEDCRTEEKLKRSLVQETIAEKGERWDMKEEKRMRWNEEKNTTEIEDEKRQLEEKLKKYEEDAKKWREHEMKMKNQSRDRELNRSEEEGKELNGVKKKVHRPRTPSPTGCDDESVHGMNESTTNGLPPSSPMKRKQGTRFIIPKFCTKNLSNVSSIEIPDGFPLLKRHLQSQSGNREPILKSCVKKIGVKRPVKKKVRWEDTVQDNEEKKKKRKEEMNVVIAMGPVPREFPIDSLSKHIQKWDAKVVGIFTQPTSSPFSYFKVSAPNAFKRSLLLTTPHCVDRVNMEAGAIGRCVAIVHGKKLNESHIRSFFNKVGRVVCVRGQLKEDFTRFTLTFMFEEHAKSVLDKGRYIIKEVRVEIVPAEDE